MKHEPKQLYFFADEPSVVEYAAPQHLEHVAGHVRLRLEVSSAAPSGNLPCSGSASRRAAAGITL